MDQDVEEQQPAEPEGLSCGRRQASVPSSEERDRLAREITYGTRYPESVDVEMTSDEISRDEVEDISLMEMQTTSAQSHKEMASSDETESEHSEEPSQSSRKRLSR